MHILHLQQLLLHLHHKGIIDKQPNSTFREAYNASYADVYDFAATKMSLKKWEIELGITHKELDLA